MAVMGGIPFTPLKAVALAVITFADFAQELKRLAAKSSIPP